MGYSSVTEVTLALANALSQGNPQGNPVAPMITIGQSLTDAVTPDEIQQYIRWADETIDSAISSIYEVPLSRVNRGSYDLFLPITTGDTNIVMVDATRFTIGEIALVRDSVNSQEVTIIDVQGTTTLVTLAPMLNSYDPSTARVERIAYSDPIPKISARLAAALVFDKHFAAEQKGNQSEYGKYLRGMAMQDLNLVLAGVAKLSLSDAGQYVGRRYQNPALDDVPYTKAEPAKDWFKGGV